MPLRGLVGVPDRRGGPQQVDASDVPEDQELKRQAYVTGCYGPLTSFDALFADEADHSRGSGGG